MWDNIISRKVKKKNYMKIEKLKRLTKGKSLKAKDKSLKSKDERKDSLTYQCGGVNS